MNRKKVKSAMLVSALVVVSVFSFEILLYGILLKWKNE